ncbi:DMT family transporter, partial [Candidatus Dojkabacteria bacterium]|nr:DMT family transporter [Candidatus Dojkabacteria bacterium]
MKEKYYGAVALLMGGFTYSTFPLLIRLLDITFSEFAQVAVRSFVAVLILVALLYRKRIKIFIPKEKRLSVALFAISFPLAIFFFTFSALETKIANTVFSLYIGSLSISFVVGLVVFREKITIKKILSLGLVFLGLMFFTYPFNLTGIAGIILGILAGIFDGITNSLRKYIKDLPRNVILFYQYLVGIILSLILILIFKEEAIKETIGIESIFAGIVYGALLVFIGNVTIYGFQKFDLNLGTILISSELVFSLILGFLFYLEKPSA